MKVKLENIFKCLPIASHLPQFVIKMSTMHACTCACTVRPAFICGLLQSCSQHLNYQGCQDTLTGDETTQCYASIHSVCVGGRHSGIAGINSIVRPLLTCSMYSVYLIPRPLPRYPLIRDKISVIFTS